MLATNKGWKLSKVIIIIQGCFYDYNFPHFVNLSLLLVSLCLFFLTEGVFFSKDQQEMKAVLFVLLVVTMATFTHGRFVSSYDEHFRRSKLYFRCMRDCISKRSSCKRECYENSANYIDCNHCQEEHDYCTGTQKREYVDFRTDYKRAPVNPKACNQHLRMAPLSPSELRRRELGY